MPARSLASARASWLWATTAQPGRPTARALAIEPNNLDALRGIGHARILLGQPQFAVNQYQTALKIAPNDTRALNGLAWRRT
jgi:Tfp pilus assembly protein PilF